MNKIEQLTEELKAHLKAAQDIAAKAEAEDRDFTGEERSEIQAKMAAAKDVKAKLEQAKADDQIVKAVAELGDGIDFNEKSAEKRTPSGLIVPDRRKSIGEHFVASPAYKGLLDSAPNGQFGEKRRVQSQPVGFKALIGVSDDGAGGNHDGPVGALVQNDWRGMLLGLEPFQRPLTLRDVVTSGSTTSDTIEYARVNSVTNNAAPVPEAITTDPEGSGSPAVTAAEAGVKPESGFTTVRETAVVKTIAHWIPATKRALSDPAQVRTLIDAFLRYGLEEELEDQMVSGDGTGENFTGLANVSGVQSQAFDTNLLTTTRRAKTKVRLNARAMANAYVFNPLDLEEIDLLTDGMDRYFFGGPASVGTAQTLWGLPVIESEAVPSGTGYVGDWRRAILWDREQASISITDSHADFFVRNLVAILAEMRAAFGVVQPSAFVEIDMAAGT